MPPYTPDTLIEVTIEGDRVWMRFADVFAEPLRLTPEQGLALVAAGPASLAAARRRRARARWPRAGQAGRRPRRRPRARRCRWRWATPGRASSRRCGGAVAESRRVEIDYYAYGRDERSTRDVDPAAVFADEGAGTCGGWCHQAGDERLFRVDRIVDVTVLDETFEPPRRSGGGRARTCSTPGRRSPGSRSTLGPERARWVVETYPVDEVDDHGEGRLRIRLPVTAAPWLERLLLRLGPDARVVADRRPRSGRRRAPGAPAGSSAGTAPT